MTAATHWNLPVCERLGIALPIVGAPMGGCAGPELVAAVSEAGGLGLLGHANMPLDEMREQIRAVKARTSRPFGVGLLFPSGTKATPKGGEPPALPSFLAPFTRDFPAEGGPKARRYDNELAAERLEVAIAEKVPVLSFGLGAPPSAIARAKGAGMTIIALVGSRRAAIEVAARGADILVAQGHESGGHTGRTATLVLVPQVVDAVKLPVLAAGGISDGRGLAAALMLGASGVLIGTRLLATPEARTADTHKHAIVEMEDDNTIVSRCYTGKPSRVIRNAFTDAWKGHDAEILPMPSQWEMIEPLVEPAKRAGSLAIANWPTGQGAVLIEAVTPAGEVVRSIAADAARLLGSASGYLQ
ncbi:MAG: nitronate monooxygenase [Alphaproteobacteria bacterium]|nr:nitronate monooxygenase [Alphaproteobacteria bacterium]